MATRRGFFLGLLGMPVVSTAAPLANLVTTKLPVNVDFEDSLRKQLWDATGFDSAELNVEFDKDFAQMVTSLNQQWQMDSFDRDGLKLTYTEVYPKESLPHLQRMQQLNREWADLIYASRNN